MKEYHTIYGVLVMRRNVSSFMGKGDLLGTVQPLPKKWWTTTTFLGTDSLFLKYKFILNSEQIGDMSSTLGWGYVTRSQGKNPKSLNIKNHNTRLLKLNFRSYNFVRTVYIALTKSASLQLYYRFVLKTEFPCRGTRWHDIEPSSVRPLVGMRERERESTHYWNRKLYKMFYYFLLKINFGKI